MPRARATTKAIDLKALQQRLAWLAASAVSIIALLLLIRP